MTRNSKAPYRVCPSSRRSGLSGTTRLIRASDDLGRWRDRAVHPKGAGNLHRGHVDHAHRAVHPHPPDEAVEVARDARSGPVAEAGVILPRDDPDGQPRHVGRAERHLVAAFSGQHHVPAFDVRALEGRAVVEEQELLWHARHVEGELGDVLLQGERLQHGRAPVSRDRAARSPLVAQRVGAGDHADGERRRHEAAERHHARPIRALQAQPANAAVVGERLAVVELGAGDPHHLDVHHELAVLLERDALQDAGQLCSSGSGSRFPTSSRRRRRPAPRAPISEAGASGRARAGARRRAGSGRSPRA